MYRNVNPSIQPLHLNRLLTTCSVYENGLNQAPAVNIHKAPVSSPDQQEMGPVQDSTAK